MEAIEERTISHPPPSSSLPPRPPSAPFRPPSRSARSPSAKRQPSETSAARGTRSNRGGGSSGATSAQGPLFSSHVFRPVPPPPSRSAAQQHPRGVFTGSSYRADGSAGGRGRWVGFARCVARNGQNHIYTMYIRYFWLGNHRLYGHIRCIYIRFWPTICMCVCVHSLCECFVHACGGLGLSGCVLCCVHWQQLGRAGESVFVACIASKVVRVYAPLWCPLAAGHTCTWLRLAIYIYIYIYIHPVFLAGKSPNIWSYTVYLTALANPIHVAHFSHALCAMPQRTMAYT